MFLTGTQRDAAREKLARLLCTGERAEPCDNCKHTALQVIVHREQIVEFLDTLTMAPSEMAVANRSQRQL